MQSRPDLSLSLPRYTIRYLDHDGAWKESAWKMTLPYAAKQYAGLEWDHIPESEEYFRPEDMPIIGQSMAKFQG